MVDGTPILDVKPYLPWYDAPMEKVVYPHWVEDARRKTLEVEILPEAEAQMRALGKESKEQGKLMFIAPSVNCGILRQLRNCSCSRRLTITRRLCSKCLALVRL